jgi:hypothetical protein
MNIQITVNGTTVAVKSPYNSEFVTTAKRYGGKWKNGQWVFDARDEERVRALCQEVYGTDGLSTGLCTIRAKYSGDWHDYADRGPIEIAGRTIARAWGRDSGAKLGEGVVVLEGGFSSGGSMKNWTTRVIGETVVLVRDFPRATAERLIAEGAQHISIEPEAPVIDRAALEAERAKLVARIAEIDALLEVSQ